MKTLQEIKEIAKENKWIVNPQKTKSGKSIAKMVIKRMNALKELKGNYFCPCQPTLVGKKDDKGQYVSICPCQTAKKDIETNGTCHCNLFLKAT